MGLIFSKIINTFTQQAPDGKEYLRVANIAPNAYNEVTDEFKVRISEGEKIKLIKSHLNYAGLITSAAAYLGDNIANINIHLLTPINVTEFPRRTVVIYNFYDQEIKLRNPIFYVDFSKTHREITGTTVADIIVPKYDTTYNVPGKVIIDVRNLPFLNTELPGMGLDIRRGAIAPTTGYVNVFLFGGK